MVAALFAFGAAAAGGFHFDDYGLLGDSVITSADGWWRAWLPLQTRPLTWFTFWANFAVSGSDPLLWHVANVGLHCACVLAAYSALRRVIGTPAAWIAAALFAVHPVATEPVAYVAARGTLLATLFCLLSLGAWLRGRPSTAVALFAAALLAKEECAAFPLFLAALHASTVGFRRVGLKDVRWREFAPIGCMLLLSLAAGLRVIWASHYLPGSGVAASSGITPASYFWTQGVVILRYLRMLIIPLAFSPDPEIAVRGPAAGMLAWACVLAAAVLAATRFQKARAGFWFLGALILLLPSSSIFPAADLAADRRLYLPLVAFAACAGVLLAHLDRRIIAALLFGFALISIRQSLVWRTEESLWTEAVRLAPNKIRPRLQLARALPWHRAVAVIEDAKRIAPNDPDLASEEGRIHLSAGRPELALNAFGRALALRPNDPKALNNRGAALFALDQREAAKADFEAALRGDPCQADARRNLRAMGFDDLQKYPWPASCNPATGSNAR